jgi:hypothetical protein
MELAELCAACLDREASRFVLHNCLHCLLADVERVTQADAPELSARDLELLEEMLQQREFGDLSELYERQGPGTGVAGSISLIRREFNVSVNTLLHRSI